ncbi:MAG: hypothetical protein HZA52_14330 [Planctomycetes bacterium]|nr:hypothetical protein [Planctomycetota bacterium]
MLAATAAPARSQSPNPQWSCDFAHAWVDPGLGIDPPISEITSQINDPDHPYRKLQTAIDALILHLDATYPGTTAPQQMGIVHALPGLYGPWSNGSGDVLPIVMRDRVHVRGTSARACVIRGGSSTTQSVFWPEASLGGFRRAREVLVDWILTQKTAGLPQQSEPYVATKWSGLPIDAAETFDAFTLQGGDVQMLIGDANQQTNDGAFAGRIANCVFDMRHNWITQGGSTVVGPYFGLMFVAPFFDNVHAWGYLDRRFVVTNNTFIMAEFSRPSASSIPTWVNACREDAVALIDVTNPSCVLSAVTSRDADTTLRGLSNLLVVNNLFRTMPLGGGWASQTKPMAMLGVDEADCRVRYGGEGPWHLSNVFDPERVGADNSVATGFIPTFYSRPVVSIFQGSVNDFEVWDCTVGPNHCGPFYDGTCAIFGTCGPTAAAPFPTPRKELWNGHNQATGGIDPGFVGEYLNQVMNPQPTPYYAYRDWRLLPGSPVADIGVSAVADEPPYAYLQAENGAEFIDSLCTDQKIFRWDGEVWGNPRVFGPGVDVGFDEVGSFIMAGSWSNDSISHNHTTALAPTATVGMPRRYVILPDLFVSSGGSSYQVQINGTQRFLSALSATGFPQVINPPPAWTVPPAALPTPVVDPTLPVDFRTRYINLTNPPAQQVPTPWSYATPTFATQYQPLLGATGYVQTFLRVPPSSQPLDDDEAAGQPTPYLRYFNMQMVATNVITNLVRWSNLQHEYR